jgi:site-specific DNA-methyltransferase (adenine-specific)
MDALVSDPDFTLYVGDVRDVLRELPAESVHCVMTSPPYWGLRDYQVEGQLGLEATPEEYVANMVAVFREVRRVLRRDGTCWLNLGDSYAGGGGGNYGDGLSLGQGPKHTTGGKDKPTTPSGLKPKDLVGIPWRLAFALQADGWYLRVDIIWSKPNPMPESVTDRPTKAHEYLFLLTKSGSPTYWTNDMRAIPGVRSKPAPDYWWFPPPGVEGEPSEVPVVGWTKRNAWRGHDYFYDADAIREPYNAGNMRNGFRGENDGPSAYVGQQGPQNNSAKGPDGRRVTAVKGQDGSAQHRDGERWPNPSGRNKRSVWEIATEPYPDAHFATFPTALVEPCVLAGTSERGCCPECGAPWVRETARELVNVQATNNSDPRSPHNNVKNRQPRASLSTTTLGWSPSCSCSLTRGDGDAHVRSNDPASPVPCVVLDPFLGSGTTALVARKHGRRSIGIELNPEYAQLAAQRLSQLSLLGESAL